MHAKVRLLHARYVAGYLAAGLLITVPLDLGYQIGHGKKFEELLAQAGLSILWGLAFLIPFGALEPFTRIPWERMRVPEFRIFELAVTRTSAIVAAALFVASIVARETSARDFLPWRLFWTVLVLMTLAWAKIKVQTWIFPEFYADRGGERVLRPPVDDDASASGEEKR